MLGGLSFVHSYLMYELTVYEPRLEAEALSEACGVPLGPNWFLVAPQAAGVAAVSRAPDG